MPTGGRPILTLLRNLSLAALLYAAIISTVELARSPAARSTAKAHLAKALKQDASSGLNKDEDFKLKLATARKVVPINPHANVYNRPSSVVEVIDAYLGKRPHVDTEADLQMLVEECRGTYAGLEKMRDVSSCLEFLAKGEGRYYHLPEEPDRASQQDPRQAEYLDADGRDNTLSRFPHYQATSKESLGRCNGPVIPYHVYWSGPATWRAEVFIKAYLYTQNLPCSRLWLWLDADRDPEIVDRFLHSDPLFARFLPLVERGDIRVLAWNFPTKMPLPGAFDHTDGIGYYSNPGPYNNDGERAIADGVIEDLTGQQYIQLRETQMTFFAQAISDAVRFVILHLHGGLYLDMDVLLLRDMRPLLLPKEHNFAERWAAHNHPGDFNTAILSLSANSSLSSYLLRGGVRMGLNFHPRVIGRMAWKEGRDQEMLMLETAAFDPIWTEFNWDREGRCTVPCLKDYSQVFKGKPGAIKNEWESFDGEPLPHAHSLLEKTNTTDQAAAKVDGYIAGITNQIVPRSVLPIHDSTTSISIDEAGDPLHSLTSTSAEVDALHASGAVADYRVDEDKYPPNNRTLANFFRGAWTYHVHNQWTKRPEPSSWLDVLQKAHDRFFDGGVNPYGEGWEGPQVEAYNLWPEFV